MKYLVVGDVHGCADQLGALLGRGELFAGRRVVFLGDYVDVGRDSAAVMELLIAFGEAGPDAIFLQGNHDHALAAYLEDGDFVAYARQGGIATIRSYVRDARGDVHAQLCEGMPSRHLAFLGSLRAFHETGEYLFSHCGYDVDDPEDRSHAAMVLTTHRRLFGEVSTLNKLAVCGHYFQPTRRPRVTGHVVCLDSGCGILNGPLTALELPEGRVFQVLPDLTWRRARVELGAIR